MSSLWVRSRTSERIQQCKGDESLALNQSFTLEWLSSCENNSHSGLPTSKLPTFSPLSNTKNAVNCEMAAGNPIGSLEMIGPFWDAYFSPLFHCLNVPIIREPFSGSLLITVIWGGELHNLFLYFFNDFKMSRSLSSPSSFITTLTFSPCLWSPVSESKQRLSLWIC